MSFDVYTALYYLSILLLNEGNIHLLILLQATS